MELVQLTIGDVEYLAHRLARETLEYDEPIPPFSTRYPNRLESCLRVPFQTFDKKDLYKTLPQKASILFYLMIKNHPFQNGNKRVAVTALFVFLYSNNRWLTVNADDLYHFAVWVAESKPDAKRGVVIAIEDFIVKYIKQAEGNK